MCHQDLEAHVQLKMAKHIVEEQKRKLAKRAKHDEEKAKMVEGSVEKAEEKEKKVALRSIAS